MRKKIASPALRLKSKMRNEREREERVKKLSVSRLLEWMKANGREYILVGWQGDDVTVATAAAVGPLQNERVGCRDVCQLHCIRANILTLRNFDRRRFRMWYGGKWRKVKEGSFTRGSLSHT